MKISIKVKTKSKKQSVEKIADNEYLVLVKETPEKGKANLAVKKALAEYFKIPQSAVHIISGKKSKRKIAEVEVAI